MSNLPPPEGEQVRDVRSGYFHPGKAATPVVQAAWLARTFSNINGNVQISGDGSVYGGAIVRAGAGAVTVTVYDATTDGEMVPANIIGTADAPAASWDGVADFPVSIQRGIRAAITGATATTVVSIYYRPPLSGD